MMLLLTFSLKCGIIRLGWVEGVSGFLVKHLGFFFIPAAVGVMNCFGLISEQWLPIVGASVISTVIVIASTGWIHQTVRRLTAPRHGIPQE